MGFFDKKSSTVNTNTQTLANTLGISDTQGGQATIFNGDGNTMTDAGAIRGALDYAEKATGRAFDFVDNADAASTQRLGMFLSAAGNAAQAAQDGAAQTVASVTDAFKQSTNPSRDLIVLGVMAASIVAVVYKVGR